MRIKHTIHCILTIIEHMLAAGADVTHPLGFSHTEPSVGAIVGSVNRECSRFASRVWLQGHRVEMLQVCSACLLWLHCACSLNLLRIID